MKQMIGDGIVNFEHKPFFGPVIRKLIRFIRETFDPAKNDKLNEIKGIPFKSLRKFK